MTQAQVTSPAYFYDLSGIFRRARKLEDAFGDAKHLVAYAIKANSAGSIVRTIAEAGGGVDAVSGGELMLARQLGVPSRKIVLSGVAKREDEIRLALEEDILAVQAESVEELQRIQSCALKLGKVARVSLRLNPSVAIDSHSHIATGHDAAKFGVAQSDVPAALSAISASENMLLVGLSTHVGSMLSNPISYLESARVVCKFAAHLRQDGAQLEYVDFGGGFGIDYGQGATSAPADFAREALALLKQQGLQDLILVVEPGRSLVGPFGVLVSQVVQSKQSGPRKWLMIDCGMNDLLRPALYQATHRIEPLDQPPNGPLLQVVGPVCESTDDFGLHSLPVETQWVAIRDAGAYGYCMASQYNGRPLPAEVFVRDGKVVHKSPSPGVAHWVRGRTEA